jgi:hypothetical protein
VISLQKFDVAPKFLTRFEVRVASPGKAPVLDERKVPLLQRRPFRLDRVDVKCQMMHTLAVRGEMVVPRAGLSDGLNQLNRDLPKIEKRETGKRVGLATTMLDPRARAILSLDDWRHFATQEISPRRSAFREIAHNNPNLADGFSVDGLHWISPLVTPARFFGRQPAV